MKRWQIGFMSAEFPYKMVWRKDYVQAESESEALKLAEERGYYNNVRVRIDTSEDLVKK